VTTVKNTPEPPKSVAPRPAPPRFDYGRPASGGSPVAGKQEGNAPSSGAPAGSEVPSMGAYSPQPYRGVAPGDSGDQVGPDFAHGASIVVPDSGDRPSGGKADANLGTVGDSGNQGAGPGGLPNP